MPKEGADTTHQSKYFFFIVMGIVAALSLLVVFPFLSAIITGAILAYIFYPVYTRIDAKLRRRGISAFIVSFLIILLVTIPVFFLLNTLTSQTRYLYTRTKQQIATGRIIGERCIENTLLCDTVNEANSLLQNENVRTYVINLLNKFLGFVTNKVSDFIISLPKIILYLLVTLFTAYYVLKDGPLLIKRIARVAPLRVHHQDEILNQIGDITYAIIYGSFIVALVQGTLGAFGFWLFGIKSFIWWGVVMTFFALIPFIGTWVVWMPASLFLILTGYMQADTGFVGRGIGLFFFGLFVISTIDNILKPYIVAGRARIHPLLILVGILGGLWVFGLIGIVVGPLILALLQTLLTIYEKERNPHLNENPDECILDGVHKHETTRKRYGHRNRRRSRRHS